MNDNEVEAFSHVKRTLLVLWIIFEFPKDINGMLMAKEKIVSIINALSFEDVEAWQRKS